MQSVFWRSFGTQEQRGHFASMCASAREVLPTAASLLVSVRRTPVIACLAIDAAFSSSVKRCFQTGVLQRDVYVNPRRRVDIQTGLTSEVESKFIGNGFGAQFFAEPGQAIVACVCSSIRGWRALNLRVLGWT